MFFLNLVSIPKRVSAKVEPSMLAAGFYMQNVSIPKRVSAKVELHLNLHTVNDFRFQSLKGFQPKWNAYSEMEKQEPESFNP